MANTTESSSLMVGTSGYEAATRVETEAKASSTKKTIMGGIVAVGCVVAVSLMVFSAQGTSPVLGAGGTMFGGTNANETNADVHVEHAVGVPSCGMQSDAAACYCEHYYVCDSKDPNIEGDCSLPCYLAQSVETGEKICVPLDDGACCTTPGQPEESNPCCEQGEVDDVGVHQGKAVYKAKFGAHADGTCGYTFLVDKTSATLQDGRPVEKPV